MKSSFQGVNVTKTTPPKLKRADTAIDVGQDAIWLPALALGPGAYVAGTAANSAAEEMYETAAEGGTAGDAMNKGVLTTAFDLVGGRVMPSGGLAKPASMLQVYRAIKKGNTKLLFDVVKNAGINGVQGGAIYLMNYLAEQVEENPDTEFDVKEFAQSVFKNVANSSFEKRADPLAKMLQEAWDQPG